MNTALTNSQTNQWFSLVEQKNRNRNDQLRRIQLLQIHKLTKLFSLALQKDRSRNNVRK